MKTQSKFDNSTATSKASAASAREKSRPHGSNPQAKTKKIDYSSMWAAIQKVADPVSFEKIKAFYNIK